jgi:RNA polymerase sigma-70 factor (ECF subfamily)
MSVDPDETADASELADARLHAALCRLDEAALAEAFSRHRDRLRRGLVFRIDPRLAGRMDVDDLLQEAYLQAARRLPHFARQNEGQNHLGVFLWLRLIVNQTLVDAQRRHLGAQARDATREVALHPAAADSSASTPLIQGLVANLTSPSQAAVRSELTQQLQQALEAMSPLDQEIIALRHFEQLSNKEIAQVLGIEEKAASTRHVRAIRRLKEILAQIPGFADLQTLFGTPK